MSTWVDVHLIIDGFERQFNMWRNIARLFARTDFVMMLDVDFALCTDFRSRIRRSEEVMEKLRQGSAALVIPAFEFVKQEDGVNSKTFPKDKKVCLQNFALCSGVMAFGFQVLTEILGTHGAREVRTDWDVPSLLATRSLQHQLQTVLRVSPWRNLQSDIVSEKLRAVRCHKKIWHAMVGNPH